SQSTQKSFWSYCAFTLGTAGDITKSISNATSSPTRHKWLDLPTLFANDKTRISDLLTLNYKTLQPRIKLYCLKNFTLSSQLYFLKKRTARRISAVLSQNHRSIATATLSG